MSFSPYYRKENCVGSNAYSRPPITILDLTIMQMTLEGPWVKQLPSTREGSSLPFFGFLLVVGFLAFLWPSLFVSPVMFPAIKLFIGFLWAFEKLRYRKRTCSGPFPT